MKTCSNCGGIKERTDFSKDKHSKDGLAYRCRSCLSEARKTDYAANTEHHKQKVKNWRTLNPEKRKLIERRAHLKQDHGLSLGEYERRLKEQGGKCAICEQDTTQPCVDHNHTTGKLRMLLCNSCNLALGLLKDSSLIAFKAASYLQKFSS